MKTEKNMSVAYYLACLETGQYVWVGAIGPDATTIPDGQSAVISSFALTHRGKALTVVSDTHAILQDGEEWETALGQERRQD